MTEMFTATRHVMHTSFVGVSYQIKTDVTVSFQRGWIKE